jgi:hypothetical protein
MPDKRKQNGRRQSARRQSVWSRLLNKRKSWPSKRLQFRNTSVRSRQHASSRQPMMLSMPGWYKRLLTEWTFSVVRKSFWLHARKLRA